MNSKEIKVYRDLMGENSKWAGKNRQLLGSKKVAMVNIIGSPGCGKTALLEKVLPAVAGRIRVAVLEGDVETTRDAERLRAVGVVANQLITGGACHLEARLVNEALKDLPLDALDLVVVENVGNLMCPAEFDIGENAKIAVLSVTEGEDKPLKYPLLFRVASGVVLTKTDLLPHLKFNIEACLGFIRQINPSIPVIRTSADSGEGLKSLVDWLEVLISGVRGTTSSPRPAR